MGNKILTIGAPYRGNGEDWYLPMDDGFHRKGYSRSYTILSSGDYAGSTQITVNSKSEYLPNECVRDERTGLVWMSHFPSSIGPDSNGTLYWDNHCDTLTLTGVTGTFQVNETITQTSPSIEACIRYVGENDDLGIVNASATFSASATVSSPSATATVVSHTQGVGEDIWVDGVASPTCHMVTCAHGI